MCSITGFPIKKLISRLTGIHPSGIKDTSSLGSLFWENAEACEVFTQFLATNYGMKACKATTFADIRQHIASVLERELLALYAQAA